MSRTALAVMAGLMCALAGLRRAGRLKADAARLRRWADLLARLALILGERTSSLPEALITAADMPALDPDRLLRGMAQQMTAVPMSSLADVFAQLCPSCVEQDALTRMFTGLGRGSLDSRRLAVEQCVKELSLMSTQAQERAGRDARLWQTLGWTGGACLTLLLL